MSANRKPVVWYGYFAALWIAAGSVVVIGVRARAGDDAVPAGRAPVVVNGTVDPAEVPSIPPPPAAVAATSGPTDPSSTAIVTVHSAISTPPAPTASAADTGAAPGPTSAAAGSAPQATSATVTPAEAAAIVSGAPAAPPTPVPPPLPTPEEIQKAIDALEIPDPAGGAATPAPPAPADAPAKPGT